MLHSASYIHVKYQAGQQVRGHPGSVANFLCVASTSRRAVRKKAVFNIRDRLSVDDEILLLVCTVEARGRKFVYLLYLR